MNPGNPGIYQRQASDRGAAQWTRTPLFCQNRILNGKRGNA
jgi:hypothetical protein